MNNSLIASLKLVALPAPVNMTCQNCGVGVFELSQTGVKTVSAQSLFQDGDTCDLIHKKARSMLGKRPYTLSATSVWGECPGCNQDFYAVEVGIVDVDVSELFTDRYFDDNLPAFPLPVYSECFSSMGEQGFIPWRYVRQYQSEIGTVLCHVFGGWSTSQLLEMSGLNAKKYFNDAFMCRANTPVKYQVTIQDLAGKVVCAFLPELYKLAVDTRAKSLETPWQTQVAENHWQAELVEPMTVHFVPGIPN